MIRREPEDDLTSSGGLWQSLLALPPMLESDQAQGPVSSLCEVGHDESKLYVHACRLHPKGFRSESSVDQLRTHTVPHAHAPSTLVL